MAQPYHALRECMRENRVTQSDIARVVKCSTNQVSNKMRNVSPWTLEEIWSVMVYLDIDPGHMAYYFPYKGRNE